MPEVTTYPTTKHLRLENFLSMVAPTSGIMNESSVQCEWELNEQLLQASSSTAAAEIVTFLANQTTRDTPLLLRVNASNVCALRLAPRHDASFVTKAFGDLKKSIRSTNGNQQPVLIQIINQKLEIVFGHRRHKACLDLGLPMLAMVWKDDLPEAEAFAFLERENEYRTSLSSYEKGCLFKALVFKNIFQSYRKLADHIHMSHAGVNAVVKVANLHELVIQAFGDPCTITTKYAEEIMKVWDAEGDSILLRAKEFCESPLQKRLPPKKILEYLLRLVPEAPTPSPLVIDKPHLGSWEKTTDGQVLVRLPASTTSTIINDISRLVQLADSKNEIQSAKSATPLIGGNPVSTDPAEDQV
jgi:ParB family chromosome partitioning protein